MKQQCAVVVGEKAKVIDTFLAIIVKCRYIFLSCHVSVSQVVERTLSQRQLESDGNGREFKLISWDLRQMLL